MPKWLTAAFALLLSLRVFSIQGQTVDEVINRYEHAMGGREKLLSMKSIYMEGIATMPDGSKLIETIYKVQGKIYRADLLSAKGNRCLIYTDKPGWRSVPENSSTVESLPENVKMNYKIQLDCAGPLVNYTVKANKVELVGNETLDGKECYRIKLTLSSGKNINYWIDAANWYIVRETRQQHEIIVGEENSGVDIKMDYFNYEKTGNGFIFPRTIKMSVKNTNITFENMEINKNSYTDLSKPESLNSK